MYRHYELQVKIKYRYPDLREEKYSVSHHQFRMLINIKPAPGTTFLTFTFIL